MAGNVLTIAARVSDLNHKDFHDCFYRPHPAVDS